MVDVGDNDSFSGATWLGYEGAALAAFVLLAFTIIRPIEIGVAVAASAVLVSSRMLRTRDRTRGDWVMTAGFFSAGLLLAASMTMYRYRPTLAITAAVILPFALVVAYLAWRGSVERAGIRLAGLVLLIGIVGTVGVMWINMLEAPEIDTLNLHSSAAQALLEGQNPYTEARAFNTSPTAPAGAEFVGYAYPPLTLVAYAGSDILFGDSRWASVIAIMITAILLIRPWVEMNRPQAGAALALGLAMVVQPGLGHVFRQAWTDPIALPLLAGVGLAWRRNPALAAVLLGLAFGTKQYFILALPLLLAWTDDYRWKRFWIATAVAALSVLPPILINPVAFWDATIGPAIDAPLRLDSSGLAGLGLDTPFAVVVLLSVAVAVWMGRATRSPSRFLVALAATLATAFLVGFQAFVNYWFFIGTLALVAVAISLASANHQSDAETAVRPGWLAGSPREEVEA